MIKELLFDGMAYLKMQAYIHAAGDYEIGGIGRVETDPNGIMHITDIRIVDQIIQPSFYEFVEGAFDKFMEDIPEEQHKEWIFNFHSHVNMGCVPSGVDKGNYDNWREASDLFIPFITNKKNEYWASVYHQQPLATETEVTNISFYEFRKGMHTRPVAVGKNDQGNYWMHWFKMFHGDLAPEVIEEIKLEVAQKAKQKDKIVSRPQHQSGGQPRVILGKEDLAALGSLLNDVPENADKEFLNWTEQDVTVFMNHADSKEYVALTNHDFFPSVEEMYEFAQGYGPGFNWDATLGFFTSKKNTVDMYTYGEMAQEYLKENYPDIDWEKERQILYSEMMGVDEKDSGKKSSDFLDSLLYFRGHYSEYDIYQDVSEACRFPILAWDYHHAQQLRDSMPKELKEASYCAPFPNGKEPIGEGDRKIKYKIVLSDQGIEKLSVGFVGRIREIGLGYIIDDESAVMKKLIELYMKMTTIPSSNVKKVHNLPKLPDWSIGVEIDICKKWGRVKSVVANSPAGKYGLKENDRILCIGSGDVGTECNGALDINSGYALNRSIRKEHGEPINLVFSRKERGGERKSNVITLHAEYNIESGQTVEFKAEDKKEVS